MTFGIIGYGSFGKLLAKVLSKHGKVAVYQRVNSDEPPASNIKFESFADTASADVVILAIGLESMDEICSKLAGIVKKDTWVADTCSVKVLPSQILEEHLAGKCKILATHPLFGPQTTQNGSIKGKNIVVCNPNKQSKDKIYNFLMSDLGLNVVEMSAEEHDREMAWVHGLTFFVGRGLMKLNPPKSSLKTGYYQKLLDLVELESSHSIELFNTVQRGNPYASEIREKFLIELQEINSEIGDQDE